MKKRIPDKFWFPWWPDKWIFGSVRIECTPAERGIWVDLLSLASKDNGHIRANEETPYPLQQLAGMLIIPEEELKNAINKFIKSKKITKNNNGTLYITKWDKYQFSERHKRRIESEMSENTDAMSDDKDAILYNSKVDDNKVNNNIEPFEKLFNELWEIWPSDSKGKKPYCKTKFLALCKAGKLEEFRKTQKGYFQLLEYKHKVENFKQRCMNLSTFLNNWEGDKELYINFTYKPPL